MKANAVIYAVAALLIGALFVANWGALSSVTSLHLLFAQVEAPLAFLLLLCLGVVLLMEFGVHALSARAWRLERRRLVSDLDVARGLAEREEASRTQALRALSEREFVAIREELDRLIAGQAALLRQEPPRAITETGPTGTVLVEPELIPPRGAPTRRKH